MLELKVLQSCQHNGSCAWLSFTNELIFVIAGFRCKVAKNCALLDYYAAISGNFLPTFRHNLSVPSSGFTNPKPRPVAKNCALLDYYAAISGNFLPTFRDNLSVPSSGFTNPKPRPVAPTRSSHREKCVGGYKPQSCGDSQ